MVYGVLKIKVHHTDLNLHVLTRSIIAFTGKENPIPRRG